MSKLQELIAELCPDGVEYKALGELGAFYGGLTGKSKNDFGSGAKFVTYNNVYGNPAIDLEEYGLVNVGPDERQNTVELGDVLFTISSENREEAGLTSVMTVDPGEAWYLNSFCTGWRLYDKSILLPDFLKHVLRGPEVREAISRTANGVTRFNISKPRLAKVRIPVPPIEVQREVVRILDEYTAAHDELVRQLEEEMRLRERQLSIARNELLTCGDEVPWAKLSDLVLMKAGKHLSSTEISDKQDEAHSFPCYGGNGLRGYTGTYNKSGERVLVGRQGALCGNVKLATGRFYATEHAVVCNPVAEFSAEWLYHLLTHMDLNQYKTKSAQPGLAVSNIQHLPVQIPELEEQETIAQMLESIGENFSSLYEELKEDLQAQNGQLTLVRNQLLSFPEKVA